MEENIFKDLIIGATASAIPMLCVWSMKKLSQRSEFYNNKYLHTFFKDRRIYTITILVIIVSTFFTVAILLSGSLTKRSIFVLFAFMTILICWHLLRELMVFWSIGFNRIESSISKTTYQDSFNSTNVDLSILGTNAYSFCDLDDFELMLKRTTGKGESLKILLAHPESEGLKQASRNRGLVDTKYQDQAKYSLGKLVHLKQKYGFNLQIKLYHSSTINSLPIFRAMFIDSTNVVASISVYGRNDHGKSLPQIFARNKAARKDLHRSMYNVLHRYFEKFWYDSKEITELESESYLKIWTECKNSRNKMVELKI